MVKTFKDMPIGIPFVVLSERLGLEAICIKLSETEHVDAWLNSNYGEFRHIHQTREWAKELEVVDWFEEDTVEQRADAAFEGYVGGVWVKEPICKCYSPQVHDNDCKWVEWKRNV